MKQKSEIITNLILERKNKGISQAQLAVMCNIPQSTIGRIESGGVNPNIATLEKIMASLGVSLKLQKKDTIPKYIKKWDKLHAIVFWEDTPVSEFYVKGREVSIKRFVLHPVKQIFYKDKMDIYELSNILKGRCWEENRVGLNKILEKLKILYYDPLEIVKKTHGVSYNDLLWIQFEGEHLFWKDVEPRSRHV